jgi:hypothetical protein
MACPSKITPEIERLRDSLAPGAELVYIDITPVPGCQPDYCHPNVARQCRRVGGERVFGWKVWNGSGYVEAEFHCCWRDPSGVLRDITEDGQGETRILFFADPARRYQEGGDPHYNRVLPLTQAGRERLELVRAMSTTIGRPPVVFVS